MKRAFGIVIVLLAIGAYLYNEHRLAAAPREWSGTIEAHTMDVGSRVGGRIQDVLVREGDNVKAGQALIVLETADWQAQRLQAQGQLEQAEAALDKVVTGRVSNARRAEIAAAQARLQAESIALEKAQLDQQRMNKLYAAGAATQADRDNADIAVRNATAQVSALKATLDQVLTGTPQDVKTAEGQVNVAKGRLQQIDISIEELTIRAPREARVEALDLRPGDILAANSTAVRLLEPSQLFVRIYVPETEMGFIKIGQQLPMYVDSFPNQAYHGTVEFISDQGEYTPRNLQTADERADQVFATRVRLDEGRDVLRAGMAIIARVAR